MFFPINEVNDFGNIGVFASYLFPSSINAIAEDGIPITALLTQANDPLLTQAGDYLLT